MNALAISVLLVSSLSAFSAVKKEVIQGYAMARVSGLRCVIYPQGNDSLEDSAVTELETKVSFLKIRTGQDPIALMLDHSRIIVSGCDLKNLNKVVKASSQFFGYAQNAPAIVTRETEASFINGFNQCVAVVNESIEINISKSFQVDGANKDLKELILTSKDSKLVDANDCKQGFS